MVPVAPEEAQLGGGLMARGGSNPSPSALISSVNVTLPLFTELLRVRASRKLEGAQREEESVIC